jgi:hypothetical protein
MSRASRAAGAERRRIQRLVDSRPELTPEFIEERRRTNRNERLIAIHESGHMVITYAVGGTAVLDKDVALTIVASQAALMGGHPDSNGSVAMYHKGLSIEERACASFAGTIASRMAFPDTVDYGYHTDAETIFKVAACLICPELLTLRGESLEREYDKNPFLHMWRFVSSPMDHSVAPIYKRYADALHALLHYSPEQLETNGISKYFAGFEGFEILRPVAAGSWALVRQNWSAIERLADEIQRRKTMSGREVHEFAQTLAVSA